MCSPSRCKRDCLTRSLREVSVGWLCAFRFGSAAKVTKISMCIEEWIRAEQSRAEQSKG